MEYDKNIIVLYAISIQMYKTVGITTSLEVGLKLNITKCAIMTVDDREKTLLVNFELIPIIQRKDYMIYFGVCIPNKGGSEEEVKRRSGMANTEILLNYLGYGKTNNDNNSFRKKKIHT